MRQTGKFYFSRMSPMDQLIRRLQLGMMQLVMRKQNDMEKAAFLIFRDTGLREAMQMVVLA